MVGGLQIFPKNKSCFWFSSPLLLIFFSKSFPKSFSKSLFLVLADTGCGSPAVNVGCVFGVWGEVMDHFSVLAGRFWVVTDHFDCWLTNFV